MQFTAQEIRCIERLRRLERAWRWQRWAHLFLGALSGVVLALYGSRLISLVNGLESSGFPAPSIAEIAILCPFCLIFLAATVCLPLRAVANWRGDPSRVLLLRLLNPEPLEADVTRAGVVECPADD